MTVCKLVDDVRGAHRLPRKLEVVARALDRQLAVRAVRLMAELQKDQTLKNQHENYVPKEYLSLMFPNMSKTMRLKKISLAKNVPDFSSSNICCVFATLIHGPRHTQGTHQGCCNRVDGSPRPP